MIDEHNEDAGSVLQEARRRGNESMNKLTIALRQEAEQDAGKAAKLRQLQAGLTNTAKRLEHLEIALEERLQEMA